VIDSERADRTLAGMRDFYNSPAIPDPDGGPAMALGLFRDAAATVPAYADFLAGHGVDPAAVRSVEDLTRLPMMTKADYHNRYPLAERCRGGRLDACDMVAVSSGSSGRPTVWPRSVLDERLVAARFEQVFRDGFGAGEASTLAVVCFALGNWVGGMYTAACCRHLAAKGYPITVATPGNNVDEILRVVAELGPHYAQVVLLGYPPFVKNVVDAGLAAGLDWHRYRIKLVLAGEVFSEEWRDLMARRAGMDRPHADVASLYGTADAGVLANETPLSARIRRFLAGRPDAARELFGESRLPTLAQYDPAARYFETEGGTLLFTGDGAVPLVRYHIADEGGLVAHGRMLDFCRDHGFDPGEDGHPQPFVYVFGRSLFTVSFFGANIYPENVTVGLEQPHIRDWVTGKFVVSSVEDEDRDRHLSVVVELAPGEASTPERERAAAASIRAELVRLNSEFANYVPPGHQTPRVALRPAGDPEHFPPGVKHRYTRQTP